jgi:hypothetical protein
MNTKLQSKLAQEFPAFFPGYHPNEFLSFEFECDDGWYNLIRQLCLDIQAANPPKEFTVLQVKQKFGELRFYVANSNKTIDELIDKAERLSVQTCEFCGSNQSVESRPNKGKYWIMTLCANCRKD